MVWMAIIYVMVNLITDLFTMRLTRGFVWG